MLVGISAIVFFSGMPSEAAGPVADSVTPTLTSATADCAAKSAAVVAASLNIESFDLIFIMIP